MMIDTTIVNVQNYNDDLYVLVKLSDVEDFDSVEFSANYKQEYLTDTINEENNVSK